VRVHEELVAVGIDGWYATLTRFCRTHSIGVTPPERVGTWYFAPGVEMQHDTSPHVVEVGGRKRSLHCGSLVLFHSRMRYCQVYPTFTRFYATAFLTEALVSFGGAAARCIVDNTHVVVASGTGDDAVMAPEMAAFAERFGFKFVADATGYAERSGRVEWPFHHVENSFYAGQIFGDLHDLNTQLRTWCETYNGTFRRGRLGLGIAVMSRTARGPAHRPPATRHQ
jgi:hypothetical protein